MIYFFIAVVLAVLIIYFLFKRSDNQPVSAERDWEYGDAWKERAAGDGESGGLPDYVEIFRGDTGRGYDDSFMLDLIGFLGSQGINATYDSFSIGMEPAGIKTYVLKVDVTRQDDAIELIRRKIR